MATGSQWQGRVGQEWADKADALDRLLGPVGETALQALGAIDGKRVLDLGCGAGATSLALAKRGAKVTGLDISEDLLAKAKSRDTNGEVEFVLADASTYQAPAPFEALFSRCGAMFFDDEISAWQHLRTQMAPRTHAAIVVWCPAEENDWARIPLELARPVLGKEATRISPPNGPGPFAWSAPTHFSTVLESAGWSGVHWQEVQRDAVMETGDAEDPVERAVAFAMRIGPLASRLRGIDEATRERVRAELRQGFQGNFQGDKVMVSTSAWLIRAVA